MPYTRLPPWRSFDTDSGWREQDWQQMPEHLYCNFIRKDKTSSNVAVNITLDVKGRTWPLTRDRYLKPGKKKMSGELLAGVGKEAEHRPDGQEGGVALLRKAAAEQRNAMICGQDGGPNLREAGGGHRIGRHRKSIGRINALFSIARLSKFNAMVFPHERPGRAQVEHR